jgi:tRNA-specific 2-thiouridylase
MRNTMRQLSSARGKKVFVGLSGGVDSAVSAALLKKQGYDVTGVFIRIWSPEWQECTAKQDRLDAMRVAVSLHIPFQELDLTEVYKHEVIEYMLAEYRAGRTPNPDVMCNKTVKFGAFFDYAMKAGADFVATGHYACIDTTHGYQLAGAKDPEKDQTYFLWTLTTEQLSRTLFPVGGYLKSEVRMMAKKFSLPNADRKDSQGLCFVGKISVKDFLARYIPQKKGAVLDELGNVIGTHNGATFFTSGERHGFSITDKTPGDAIRYVVAKDVVANTITVAPRIAHTGDISQVKLGSLHWISGTPTVSGTTLSCRFRHRGARTACAIEKIEGDTAVIAFTIPQAPIAPGQSLVLYDGSICLGGGIIA